MKLHWGLWAAICSNQWEGAGSPGSWLVGAGFHRRSCWIGGQGQAGPSVASCAYLKPNNSLLANRTFRRTVTGFGTFHGDVALRGLDAIVNWIGPPQITAKPPAGRADLQFVGGNKQKEQISTAIDASLNCSGDPACVQWNNGKTTNEEKHRDINCR